MTEQKEELSARVLSLQGATAKLNEVLNEQGVEDEYRRAAHIGYIDGHKAGWRASAGATYVALNVVLEADHQSVESVCAQLRELQGAIKEAAR